MFAGENTNASLFSSLNFGDFWSGPNSPSAQEDALETCGRWLTLNLSLVKKNQHAFLSCSQRAGSRARGPGLGE